MGFVASYEQPQCGAKPTLWKEKENPSINFATADAEFENSGTEALVQSSDAEFTRGGVELF